MSRFLVVVAAAPPLSSAESRTAMDIADPVNTLNDSNDADPYVGFG